MSLPSAPAVVPATTAGARTKGEHMKALTVRQPWAGLIARGIKDIENRTWAPTLALGDRFAVHAGRRDDALRVEEYGQVVNGDLDHPLCHAHGIVVCTVQLVAVTRTSRSPWAIDGHWHWVLDDPYEVHDARAPYHVHLRGHTGLWELPE